MLTKNCKAILNYYIALPMCSRIELQSISSISTSTGISENEIRIACEKLHSMGYVVMDFYHIRGSEILKGVRITEDGLNYKKYVRKDIFRYILSKWIDFLALVIAAIALIRTL